MNNDETRSGPASGPEPRLRLPLATAGDVRRELARLYREGKSGRREVADVSRLANVLQILGRMISESDLERRIEALEASQADGGSRTWPAH